MKFSIWYLILNCISSLQFGFLVTKPIMDQSYLGYRPVHYGIIIGDNIIYEFNKNISRNVSFEEFDVGDIIDIPPKDGWEQRYQRIAASPPNYNLFRCNCEHVARWIHDNEYYSTQLPTYHLRKLFSRKK